MLRVIGAKSAQATPGRTICRCTRALESLVPTRRAAGIRCGLSPMLIESLRTSFRQRSTEGIAQSLAEVPSPSVPFSCRIANIYPAPQRLVIGTGAVVGGGGEIQRLLDRGYAESWI